MAFRVRGSTPPESELVTYGRPNLIYCIVGTDRTALWLANGRPVHWAL
jgi:hypothetical protein